MRFLKIVLGSCLGSIIALLLLTVGIVSFFTANLASTVEQKPAVEANSILYFDFSNGLPEHTGNTQLTSFDPTETDAVGIHDLIRTLEAAAQDDNIKGIFLRNGTVPASFTTVRQLRRAVEAFKESGKFVTAYSPVYSQSGYYLASVADDIYLGQLGVVDFRGMGAEVAFYKGLFDKVGIKMEVFKVGDYKSAVEPYLREDMSPENRAQIRAFLDDLYTVMVEDLAVARNISTVEVRRAADAMTGWKEQEAVAAGLIDGILHRSEMELKLREKLGFEPDQKLNMISSTNYYSARVGSLSGGSNQVAVVMAEGTIVDGQGTAGNIGDKKYIKELDDLAENDRVKAVVLRINSPGGSASSSENIWYAVERLKDAGKPVVVSMGDYAASGGYYFAAGADSIIAEPTTITGSIGVFMTFPIMKQLMNDKLGVTFDTVNTARNANAFNPFFDVSPEQKAMLQSRAVSIYSQFIKRVADGRDLPESRVREIASGRVYSGQDAQEIGLVDRLGNLEDAVATAARMADINEEYSVGYYPRTKPYLERFINEFLGIDNGEDQVSDALLRQQLGDEGFRHFEMIREASQMQGAQAKLPMVLTF